MNLTREVLQEKVKFINDFHDVKNDEIGSFRLTCIHYVNAKNFRVYMFSKVIGDNKQYNFTDKLSIKEMYLFLKGFTAGLSAGYYQKIKEQKQ